MADIKIGISGSEVTVAHTLTLSLPTSLGKNIKSATMSDGSVRYGFYLDQRRWQLQWVKLTAAQLADLVTLSGYKQALKYQNNDESATWYDVVIASFAYDVINPTDTTVYYTAQMTLEQVI